MQLLILFQKQMQIDSSLHHRIIVKKSLENIKVIYTKRPIPRSHLPRGTLFQYNRGERGMSSMKTTIETNRNHRRP